MKNDILRQLLLAHADGDESAFRKAALQLASAESEAGHIRIAEDLRTIVAKMPSRRSTVVDIAAPRGELGDVLEGGHRQERLADIVLTPKARALFERMLEENRSREKLERFGVAPRRKLLFHGPPGCGKTLGAGVLAGEMGLPLMTVRLDALFSRFLGATATHLRAIFGEMPRRPGVYLFDEFDAVAKARGDSHDVGEMMGKNNVALVRKLIALALDPGTSEEEARSAALEACRRIAAHGIVLSERETSSAPARAVENRTPEQARRYVREIAANQARHKRRLLARGDRERAFQPKRRHVGAEVALP